MGICMSSETRVKMDIINVPPNYLKQKVEEPERMAVEHANYDYREVSQVVETRAVVCLPHAIGFRPDRIAIVDLDEDSPTYSKVIHSCALGEAGEEPGRMNWTRSAANLDDMAQVPRSHMVVPCMDSSRIYVVAVEEDSLKVVKVIGSDSLLSRDMSCPYAVHSLPMKGAPVHVSTMGDKDGHGKGDFLLIDRKTFEIRERHNKDESVGFGGDFSLQTRHNVLISCEWGHPRLFRNGFSPSDMERGEFGNRLHVWQISPGQLKQSIELDPVDGCLTTTVRFLHNGDCNHAFACSAIGSTLFHLFMESVDGRWTAEPVARIPAIKVSNWICGEMPALLTDLVISMDDRWLYACGWLHGCIWQFDIADPFRVSLTGKISLGGLLTRLSDVVVETTDLEDWHPPEATTVKGVVFRGGPSSLQMSLDGKRLYVSNSFYKAWDCQFYPEVASNGGQIVRVDIGAGGMRINQEFLLDFRDMSDGPFVARDIRFFGGDCTGDNFL